MLRQFMIALGALLAIVGVTALVLLRVAASPVAGPGTAVDDCAWLAGQRMALPLGLLLSGGVLLAVALPRPTWGRRLPHESI